MTQIFHPRSGLLVKLIAIALVAVVLAGILGWRSLTADPHAEGASVEQPIPFSHKHHVGDVGLDCRYCHTTVETSAFAGMPPVSTCMTCHSQLFTDQPMFKPLIDAWVRGMPLAWNRVNQLPDFVYFNHSIHVAKGVGCESCHGRVDQMPLMRREHSLSMKWCLDCHRAPQDHLRPREHVFDMAWKADDQRRLGEALVAAYRIDVQRLTDCSVCHR